MTGSVPDLPGNEVVFRRARSSRKPLLMRSVTTLVFAVLAALVGLKMGPPMFVIAGLLGAAAVGLASAYAIEGGFRTVLRPDGISIRGYVRRTIPWAEVAGFRVHGDASPPAGPDPADGSLAVGSQLRRPIAGGRNRPGWNAPADPRSQRPSPRMCIDVVRTHGRRPVRLPAPVVAGEEGDYRFTDDLRELERWCKQYGGMEHLAPLR